jgi:hypothetical protein
MFLWITSNKGGCSLIFFDPFILLLTAVSYTKKVRSLYRQQMNALVVTAFKNGSRLECARVAAPNFSMVKSCFIVPVNSIHITLIYVDLLDDRLYSKFVVSPASLLHSDTNGFVYNILTYLVSMANSLDVVQKGQQVYSLLATCCR